jgi:hypothetical protein
MVVLYAYLLIGFIVILTTGIVDMLARSFHVLVLDSLARPERSHRKKALFGGLPVFILLCIGNIFFYPVVLYFGYRNRRRANRSKQPDAGIEVPYKKRMPGFPPLYQN